MADATGSKVRRPGRKNIQDLMKDNMKLDVIDPSTAPHRYAKLNGLHFRKPAKFSGTALLFCVCSAGT